MENMMGYAIGTLAALATLALGYLWLRVRGLAAAVERDRGFMADVERRVTALQERVEVARTEARRAGDDRVRIDDVRRFARDALRGARLVFDDAPAPDPVGREVGALVRFGDLGWGERLAWRGETWTKANDRCAVTDDREEDALVTVDRGELVRRLGS
jgi:hypothetical protein